MDIKIIGVAGGSGSGKTTLAKKLAATLDPTTPILSMDDYYKPIEEQTIDDFGYHNFDLPVGLNLSKYGQDLSNLKQGEALELGKYNFNNPQAKSDSILISPEKYLITEGIFILHKQEVVDILDIVIYVDADMNTMLKRRLKRDIETRGIERELVQYQWEKHFVPAFNQFILPKKSIADLIVDGNKPFDIHGILEFIK